MPNQKSKQNSSLAILLIYSSRENQGFVSNPKLDFIIVWGVFFSCFWDSIPTLGK